MISELTTNIPPITTVIPPTTIIVPPPKPTTAESCEDIWKKKKCKKNLNNDKCNQKAVKKNCQKTCRFC